MSSSALSLKMENINPYIAILGGIGALATIALTFWLVVVAVVKFRLQPLCKDGMDKMERSINKKIEDVYNKHVKLRKDFDTLKTERDTSNKFYDKNMEKMREDVERLDESVIAANLNQAEQNVKIEGIEKQIDNLS